MAENQDSITSWQAEAFGPTDPLLALERVDKEYTELWAAVRSGDLDAARDECADVLITLYRVAEELGIDIHRAVDRKMAVNRARTWVVDAKGHGQHV